MGANAELVTRVYEAMAAKDIETLVSMIDPAVTIYQSDELPWGGRYEGVDGFGEFTLKLLGTVTSAVETERLYEAGDHVVQSGRTRGTVNATGAEFDVAETHIWEIRDGKIVSFQAYIDTPTMRAALDANGRA